MTGAPSAPDPPTFSGIGASTITINWNPPSDDGGADIRGYTLRRWKGSSPSGSHTDFTVDGTTYNDTSLSAATAYTYEVNAYNIFVDDYGEGPFSSPATQATDAGAWVRYENVWRPAVPYVREGGVWKQAQPNVRVAAVWKATE